MTTVPNITKEVIDRSTYLKDAMAADLINLSSLARKIRPEIEERLVKDVSEASVVMALKRYSAELRYNPENKVDFAKHYGDITLKSGLFESTYTNSPTLYKTISKLMSEIDNKYYLTFVKGVWQTTLIASDELREKVEKALSHERFETSFDELTAITVKLHDGHIEQPGLISHVLNILSWEGVNIIEVVSTWDELTLILKNKQVELAFGILNRKLKRRF